MIDYKDIKTAVNKQLSNLGIDIQSRDVREGFNRPSFFVQLDNASRSNYTTQIGRMLTVRIYYFPSDRYEYAVEVLEMQDELEQLFDLKLPVKDRLLNITDLESGMSDGVLQCSFELEFEFGREEEEADKMEKLLINNEQE